MHDRIRAEASPKPSLDVQPCITTLAHSGRPFLYFCEGAHPSIAQLQAMATHRNPYPAYKDWRAAVEALVVPQPGQEANTPPLLKWNVVPE